MLVLTRKQGEALVIGDDVRIRVVSVSGGQVRIAIEAPDGVAVHREEVYERIVRANREAADASAAPVVEGGARPREPFADRVRDGVAGRRGRW